MLPEQKVTFEFLKSHLWEAADILRGSLDAGEYRQPVMTLLFLKRLNDTFEENAEKLLKQGKSQKEAYENPARHNFFIPKQARWKILSETTEKVGETIDQKIKKEREIIGWKTKTSSEKNLRVIIYDILSENNFKEEKIGELSRKIIDLAKHHL